MEKHKRHAHKLNSHLKRARSSKQLHMIIFTVVFGLAGFSLLLVTRANTPTAAIEAEDGTIASGAIAINDASASGGKAVQFKKLVCTGVTMTQGQTDINNNPAGTTFCISGTKTNWSLTPKSGNTFIGDGSAVLDGTKTTQYAIRGNSGITNVTLRNIEIKNYTTSNQHGAIEIWQAGTGWVLDTLQVHDNGYFGANLANGASVTGGRYYDNGQGGITGGSQDNWTVDGVEIDHNNFTDKTYTTRNIDCGFEAGGMKWVGDNVTVTNSKVHDNACKGLWADIGAVNNTISNNEVYNNWDEGIFFEISTSANITGNTAYGNGWKDISGCVWGWGGGITTSTSGYTNNGTGYVNITGNTVYDNCNGITILDQNRTDSLGCSATAIGRCQVLNVTLSGNNISGSTRAGAKNATGAWTDIAGNNLQNHNITFGTNTIGANMNYCRFSCP